jgi:glycosyltransferase involved in cell wall biosynthesis
MDISIILCIYNCENRIKQVINSIFYSCTNFHGSVELIIIDNNSKDLSLQEVKGIDYGDINIKILEEKKQGLIYSRINGVKNSKGMVGIFIDDDNLIDKNYIREAFNYIKNNNNIYALGGQIEPLISEKIPLHLFNYGGDYALGVQSLEDGLINERGYIWGAGLVTRLDIVRNMYSTLFPTLTGRIGDKKASGEDGELIKWLRIAGGDIAYSSKLTMKHIIPMERLSINYLLEVQKGFLSAIHIQRIYDLIIAILDSKTSLKFKIKSILYGLISLTKVDISTLNKIIKNIIIIIRYKQ